MCNIQYVNLAIHSEGYETNKNALRKHQIWAITMANRRSICLMWQCMQEAIHKKGQHLHFLEVLMCNKVDLCGDLT
jgi:hypothetical protein